MLAAMAGLHGFGGKLTSLTLLFWSAAASLLLPSSHELVERWLKPYPALAAPLAATFAFLLLRINSDVPVTFIYFQF